MDLKKGSKRKFDGKVYTLDSWVKTKTEAGGVAAWWRDGGRLARITPGVAKGLSAYRQKGYYIWIR